MIVYCSLHIMIAIWFTRKGLSVPQRVIVLTSYLKTLSCRSESGMSLSIRRQHSHGHCAPSNNTPANFRDIPLMDCSSLGHQAIYILCSKGASSTVALHSIIICCGDCTRECARMAMHPSFLELVCCSYVKPITTYSFRMFLFYFSVLGLSYFLFW